MSNKSITVGLIGAGAVGTSFLYSAMNRGVAHKYGIIDVNVDGALGNKLDLEDAAPVNYMGWETEVFDYPDLKDANVLVITAGRPQKPGETRLEMVADNAKIMKDIALKVKASGFKGVTIIASNPVDIMTWVYMHVTGFKPSTVISSGTSLDTARYQIELSKMIGIAPQSIHAYILGEHGDSSVGVVSSASVAGKSLDYFLKQNNTTREELDIVNQFVARKAYEIINRKRATFYGIGAALANLVQAVIRDTKEVYACGACLNGEYGYSGIYVGTPAVLGAQGIERIIEIDMNDDEKVRFDKSVQAIQATIEKAREAIQ